MHPCGWTQLAYFSVVLGRAVGFGGNTPDPGARSPCSVLSSLWDPGHGTKPAGPRCPHLQINKTATPRAIRLQGALFCKAMWGKNESKCRVVLCCCSGYRQAALILCFPIMISKKVARLPWPLSPAIPPGLTWKSGEFWVGKTPSSCRSSGKHPCAS